MKPLLFFFLLTIGVAQPMRGADLYFKVTDENLTSWQSTGIDPAAQNKLSRLTLPAGARISRSFSGGTVILHTVSQPRFALKNTNWPIVIAGPVALVFQQENGQGRVMLVDAAGAIKTVLGVYPIDETGKSIKPLDLALAYDPSNGTVVVAVDEQLQSFQQTAGPSLVEILLSAGADAPWALDSLEVELLSAEKTGEAITPKNTSVIGVGKGVIVEKSNTLVKKFLAGQTGDTASENSPVGSPASVTGSKDRIKLEIFTPPAVRKLNPDAMRVLLQKAQSK